MKKFLRKCLLFAFILVCLLGGISSFILFGIPEQFDRSYQHALYLQYNALEKIRQPKLVIMGDSSVPFSLDTALLSKRMHRPVQTLGLHSGTGIEYILELSKKSVRRGDIMVLELTPQTPDSFSPAIVLTACENHFEMYRAFNGDEWDKAIRYFPSFLIKKVKYYFHDRDKDIPSYSIQAFDRSGNYVYVRKVCTLPAHLQQDERDTEFSVTDYSDGFINYLNDYTRYCREKGAAFLISFPPFLNESLISPTQNLNEVQGFLARRLKAPVITHLRDREFSRRYFYDNVTHCNTVGAEIATSALANDIDRYLNKGKPQGKGYGLRRPGQPARRFEKVVLLHIRQPMNSSPSIRRSEKRMTICPRKPACNRQAVRKNGLKKSVSAGVRKV